MSQPPEQHIHRPMDREIVQDQDQVMVRPVLSQRIQKQEELLSIAARSAEGQRIPAGRFKPAEDPDFAPSSIVRFHTRPMTSLRPTRRRIGLGTDWPHFIHTDHLRVGWRVLVQANYRPLFSANCGSGLWVKYVFSWYHFSPSRCRISPNWLRETGILSTWFTYSTNRSSVQWVYSNPNSDGRVLAVVTIRPRSSSLYVIGRPERGSSLRLSKPCSLNRCSRSYTVGSLRPTPAATSLGERPSASSRMIQARSTCRCSALRDRFICSSCSRSSSLSGRSSTRFGIHPPAPILT